MVLEPIVASDSLVGSDTNLCISDADVLMPRHSNSTMPVMATSRRNLVLARNAQIALDGGKDALATFQFSPPLGRSILATEDYVEEVVKWPASRNRCKIRA